MPLTRSARMTTPNHRSAAASATQIRCPPLLNCVALTFRSVSPHSFLTFSRSKTSRFSTVPRWLAEKGTDLSADLSTGREVEAAKVKCSFSSSKSQTLTDRTLNVSEISFAAATKTGIVDRARSRLREPCPDLAKIVLRTLEMLADETLDPLLKPV